MSRMHELVDPGKPTTIGVGRLKTGASGKCARCLSAFGRFYNTGASCPRCRLRVCRQCRRDADPDWLCSLCHKIERVKSSNCLSALDIIKYSIRRAWTINGPPARWSAARKSAEYRLYRSLPSRRRDFLDDENNKKTTNDTLLIKPTAKVITKPTKQQQQQQQQNEVVNKKSSIPVFRSRSSKEFEDIRETPKRSLIPQRYRGSTDDLRRSREDISIPSFIPKLLSPRNKEDKQLPLSSTLSSLQLKRQDSRDDVRKSQSLQNPSSPLRATTAFSGSTSIRLFRRDEHEKSVNSQSESQVGQECPGGESSKMTVDESQTIENKDERADNTCSYVTSESKEDDDEEEEEECDKNDEATTTTNASGKELDKQRLSSEPTLGKKIDEPLVVRRKFSKEELSTDDTDDAHNRRCSSHLSPEASPLSTRSSKYSPRESESEPTPALPRKIVGERGESSLASQRIRDAITRTRRESNSSAKYESSGSEGVRLGESGLSSYVDIARRVKLFSSGSLGPSAGSCDEILQRDSATSAGEDDHDDHSRIGPGSNSRVMIRRRRQFDAQGPRRRGRSHARACCGVEEPLLNLSDEVSAASALLDYRRLVFISSDSSSGREEDDADSSCSGSSYLNGNPTAKQQQQQGGLEDCDWDYFESNSLKLPPLQGASQTNDWSCCPARPQTGFGGQATAGCCQACGGSRNAKVLPVPVPIPVPVPYPVPVPASLWTGELAANSMISREHQTSLPLNLRSVEPPSAGTWFSWNPGFDSSSLLFSQSHIFPRELSSSTEALLQPTQEKSSTKQQEKLPEVSSKPTEPPKPEETKPEPEPEPPNEPPEPSPSPPLPEQEPEQEPQMMFHDSHSSSGRSSADSSDLEDSASHHRFSRVMIVNDDSLTSDNDIEDNEDSDSAKEARPASLNKINDSNKDNPASEGAESVVLRKIRVLDENAEFTEKKPERSESEDDEEEEKVDVEENKPQEIASYDEIYLASMQDYSENSILLKSIRPLDPEDDYPRIDDDSSNDSAVMPDSLEVSMQDLEDSIEVAAAATRRNNDNDEDDDEETCDIGGAILASSSPVMMEVVAAEEEEKEEGKQQQQQYKQSSGFEFSAAAAVAVALTTSAATTANAEVSSAESIEPDALMAKSRKKWQIPASFDIKGIPSTHFLPPEPRVKNSPLLAGLLVDDVEQQQQQQQQQEEDASTRDDELLLLPPQQQRTPTPEQLEEEEEEEEEEDEEEEEEEDELEEEEYNFNDDVGNHPRRDWVSPNNNRYRSLVMITQQSPAYQPVNVITSDTTTLLQPLQQQGFYSLDSNLERKNAAGLPPKKPLPCKRLLTTNSTEPEVDSGLSVGSASESDEQSVKKCSPVLLSNREEESSPPSTLLFSAAAAAAAAAATSAVQQETTSFIESKRGGPLILEEGLADDDSWVEEISHDEDEQSATTATEESSEDEAGNNLGDREEELRGYHRQAIDFTLHTIVEESCEESEAENTNASWRRRLASASAPELDKYFFFGLGADGNANNSSRELDSLSESSSIFSEGLDSLTREETAQNANQEKSSSGERSEKYYFSEFLGLDQDRRDSDGSVGSDSEGRPSPEAQRRKRLVRARGTGRSHSSSLDNLLALQNSGSHQNSLQDTNSATDAQESQSEGSSTETDVADENPAPGFGSDGQFDTVKRKKKKLRNPGATSPRVSEDVNKTPEPSSTLSNELAEDESNEAAVNSEEDGAKTPQPENILAVTQPGENEQDDARAKQQSRDSGFVGSCDDLLQRNNGNEAQEGTKAGENVTETKDYEQQPTLKNIHERIRLNRLTATTLTRKDSFNNWSSDEETNLMMSKMRQFFKTMVANNQNQSASTASSAASPAPSPSPRFSVKARNYVQNQSNRTKPPQLVYFENELTRLMKTVPGIRDDQVREIVEYLSSEDTWSDSYDSSDYTSSDLEGATAGGRRSALQEQISQSCQQIISKFDTNNEEPRRDTPPAQQPGIGRDTAFVYQKLVQSFTKMAGDNTSSDANSTPHSSPPLIAKVMHHIGSRLVALMHEVSESNSTAAAHTHNTNTGWRRYPHHRTPSSASTTEDDDSTSDSAGATTHLPRSKSHDPLLLINGHTTSTSSMPPETEEREASDYERFSWRGSFESALMAADSRTKLSLLACSGDVSATAMAAKRRSAGDLLFNPKSFSREQLDRVRSCGSIGGGTIGGTGTTTVCGGSIEEKIWSNRRRSSVPDANTRGESGASAGDEDTEDEDDEDLDYGDSRATTLPRGMQPANMIATSTTNSLPRQSGSSMQSMHKAHSVYHFLPQHSAVKSARYRPPGFTRNSPLQSMTSSSVGPKRALSAPGLQLQSRTRRQQQQHASNSANASSTNVSASGSADEASSLSEACSTPIIGASSRTTSSHSASIDLDDIDRGFNSSHHLATRASLSSLGARSDSMASVYSGAGEGRWCGSVAVRGEVEFSLQYDYKQLTFEVHVTQCRDLAPVDVKRNRSDPYVKVYLLPDKSKSGKRKTKVKKHTLNPVFDETLKFHTSLNSLETRTLWLTVWHSDMFGRNDFLGEVRMPLENKIFDDPRPQWYPLQERTEPFDDPVTYKGEVIVGLKFVPPDPTRQERERDAGTLGKTKKNWSRGALHVLVKEARNLQTRAKNSGTCDPFCKSYLLPDKGRSGKQKTGVVRRSTGSPVWNHTFVYKDVSIQELAERGLELTVWDHDRIASNEFLGGVRFNLGTGKHYGKAVDWMDATGREMSLWQSMLERPNFWVEGAVTLRPNLHNHVKTGTS